MSTASPLFDASYVAYHHRSFGPPTISTLLKAARRGWLPHLPRLTARLVMQNPPLPPATSFGHLDLISQHLQSSRRQPPPLYPRSHPPFPAPPGGSFSG